MTESIANTNEKDKIKKSVGNKENRTCQTHCLATLICLTKMTKDARDTKIRRSNVKRILSNYAQG